MLRVFLAALVLSFASPLSASAQGVSAATIERLKEIDKFTKKIKQILTPEQLQALVNTGYLSVGKVSIHLNDLNHKQKADLKSSLMKVVGDLNIFVETLDPLVDFGTITTIRSEIKRYETFMEYLEKPTASVLVSPLEFKLSLSSLTVMGHHSYVLKADTFDFRDLFSLYLESIPVNAELLEGFVNLRNLK
jgi:hypothetical protein